MNLFEINVADLRRSRASEREVEVSATVDWALELSRVQPTEDSGVNVTATLTLTPVGGGLLVHGVAEFVAEHTCHRCLNVWTQDMVVPISAMYVSNSAEDDGETFPLGDVIDLEPALRDDVLLSLPISPTCPDGCDLQLVGGDKNGLNTGAHADEKSADGIPEDLSGEGSPFSVLRDLLEPGD